MDSGKAKGTWLSLGRTVVDRVFIAALGAVVLGGVQHGAQRRQQLVEQSQRASSVRSELLLAVRDSLNASMLVLVRNVHDSKWLDDAESIGGDEQLDLLARISSSAFLLSVTDPERLTPPSEDLVQAVADFQTLLAEGAWGEGQFEERRARLQESYGALLDATNETARFSLESEFQAADRGWLYLMGL